MTRLKRRSRSRPFRALAAGPVLTLLLITSSADARPYTVFSCDSASFFGHSAAAWTPYQNAGSAYATCPSGGGFTAGISNRLTDGPYSAWAHSGHAFTAPPETTITHLRWAGRISRARCHWGAYVVAFPSGAPVLGLPNEQYCHALDWDTRNWPMVFQAPHGTTRIDQAVVCVAHECPGGAAIHSHVVEVTIDDPTSPSISLDGPLASGQWVSGRAAHPSLSVAASDNTGIQNVGVTLGGRSSTQAYSCNWSETRPCRADAREVVFPASADLPDGRHVLQITALDAASNSTDATRDVFIDNTPPDPVVPEVAGQGRWRQTNGFAVSWTNPPESAAPIVRARWKLCTVDGACMVSGHHDERGVEKLPLFNVPEAGDYRMHVWLEDAAGNQREANAAVSAPLRFDPEPPQLEFEPVDPGDPLQVVVSASDAHSGLASGEIEMRAAGAPTWHGLATKRQAAALTARVDDERFRNGLYEFRARAADHAGNEASTGRRSDGTAAMIRLPARIETRLAVGVPRMTVRRTLVRRRGHRKVIRRRVRSFDRHLIVRSGRRLRLRGLLTNVDGQPIEAATVEALEASPGGLFPIGLATTEANGKFGYLVRATRNRDLVFRYAGSTRIGSARAGVTVSVPAATTMRADRRLVLNGQRVIFTGRVTTVPLPAGGKLIEMQAHFRGRWRTFSTVRTGGAGRWRFPYRFGATVGRVAYRFRARLPVEGGYPFIAGRSAVVTVIVTGP